MYKDMCSRCIAAYYHAVKDNLSFKMCCIWMMKWKTFLLSLPPYVPLLMFLYFMFIVYLYLKPDTFISAPSMITSTWKDAQMSDHYVMRQAPSMLRFYCWLYVYCLSYMGTLYMMITWKYTPCKHMTAETPCARKLQLEALVTVSNAHCVRNMTLSESIRG